MFQQGDRSGNGADANFKKHLGSQSIEELKKDLDKLFEEEERVGIQADPEIVAAYYAAIEEREHNEQTQVPGNFERSWAIFTQNHPDLFPKPKERSRNWGMYVRRVIEVTVLLAAVLVLSAAAFHWPDYVMTWGKELLHISPVEMPSGVMELSEPNIDGYFTLAEAAADLGSDEVSVPSWIPEIYSIKTIVFQKASAYNRATAIYVADTSELVVRVAYYFDQTDMPDWLYEDNGEKGEDTQYEYKGQKYTIVSNFGRVQATWKSGNCLYSISGNVSVKEMERMVNSTYGG